MTTILFIGAFIVWGIYCYITAKFSEYDTRLDIIDKRLSTKPIVFKADNDKEKVQIDEV